MNWKIVLTACMALLLAFGVRWFMPSDRIAPPAVTAPDTRFDYTLTDFSARFRDEHDTVELLVSGPRLEHVAESRIGFLVEPDFHIEPEGADWRGQARGGRILRENEELVLEDDVTLVHAHPDGEIRIVAQSLHHHRARRTITSNQTVEIHHAGSFLRAGGLIIRLDDNTIELTDNVQGQFLPAAVTRGTIPDADPSGDG